MREVSRCRLLLIRTHQEEDWSDKLFLVLYPPLLPKKRKQRPRCLRVVLVMGTLLRLLLLSAENDDTAAVGRGLVVHAARSRQKYCKNVPLRPLKKSLCSPESRKVSTTAHFVVVGSVCRSPWSWRHSPRLVPSSLQR